MFNKATAKIPPRIEKWIMEVQDLDFELIYEPGKDEADPMDYLSRHPLPETGREDNTEKIVRWTGKGEPAVLLTEMREETSRDENMIKLIEIIQSYSWEKHRTDTKVQPYYHLKDELSVIEGLVYRLNKIVVPAKLQKRIIRIGHQLGHLGKTKTKQLLREKYWFPWMNTMIEQAIDQCYECKVTTKETKEEPVKPTTIPTKAWERVAMDFGGPYPDGHYNLVIIDQRTRYPVVEEISSTSFKPTREKMKSIFATYGSAVLLPRLRRFLKRRRIQTP